MAGFEVHNVLILSIVCQLTVFSEMGLVLNYVMQSHAKWLDFFPQSISVSGNLVFRWSVCLFLSENITLALRIMLDVIIVNTAVVYNVLVL